MQSQSVPNSPMHKQIKIIHQDSPIQTPRKIVGRTSGISSGRTTPVGTLSGRVTPQSVIDDAKRKGIYKITMCKSWESLKYCPKGSDCTFAHGSEDLMKGICWFGENCNRNKNGECPYDHLKSIILEHPEQEHLEHLEHPEHSENLEHLEHLEQKMSRSRIQSISEDREYDSELSSPSQSPYPFLSSQPKLYIPSSSPSLNSFQLFSKENKDNETIDKYIDKQIDQYLKTQDVIVLF